MVAVKLVAVNVVVVLAILVAAVAKLSNEDSQRVIVPVCPLKVKVVELVVPQKVALPAIVPPTGAGETVTALVVAVQPSVVVNVKVAVPTETPVMTPELFIVATDGSELDHVPDIAVNGAVVL